MPRRPRRQDGPPREAPPPPPQPPQPEPMTEQLPPVRDEAGRARRGAPLLPRRAPGTSRRPAAPGQQPSQSLPVRGAPGEFPGSADETAVQQDPPTEFHEKVEGFDDKAAARFDDYEAHDDYSGERVAEPRGRAATADRPSGDFDVSRLDGDRLDGDDLDEDVDRDDLDDDRAGDEPDLDELEDLAPDGDEDDRETSPAREWLVMGGQLALGVVGGAAVWLGFNWLWRVLAPAALVGAVVVIVGLVLIVRKIRKAEDLQTTVLAVLVGLVVTVSPAVLLLLGR
ncbi:hypothetical protein BJP25_29650 [Actinokineospora bangkokensis]|uniref:Uncharacterized protein n=1 Tax=Actinokineospora bangkokensis TaxID=1193682 RepID=A0A1Q9LGM1_9PSEU|nr:hypothetical protein BJP25_29650 [Actinokineospora bangkokensis]